MELVKDAIVAALTNLGQTIINGFQSVIEFLFVPSHNLFNEVEVLVQEHFDILPQIIFIYSNIIDVRAGEDIPSFGIHLYGKYMEFIDFSMFDQYRVFIHDITVTIAYFYFFKWLLYVAPTVINGLGATEMYNSFHGEVKR